MSLQYYGWRLANAALSRLPLRVSYAVATLVGALAFGCWLRGRRNVLRNYARVLPGAPHRERARIGRASLVNYCKYLVDFMRLPSMLETEVCGACSGEAAFAELNAALGRGKGVIGVPMHFGNWDLGAAAVAARGYDATVVAETFGDPRLDAMVVGARERLGLKVVRMEHAGPGLLRLLRRGGLLALLIDRPTPGQGVAVSFFGRTIEVPAGPARLALASGAAVVAVAFRRVRPNAADVEVLSEFIPRPERTGDRAADVRALTQAIVRAHERFIHAYPEQWYMFREMWPRRESAPE